MDKLERYRSCIQTLLEKHSQFKSRNEDVENELFFDPVRDAKEEIILGLHPPYKRPYTGYGVA